MDEIRKCKLCGADFTPISPVQVFCGRGCANKWRYSQNYLCTCVVCGKSFDSSKPTTKFCSKQCYDKHRNEPKVKTEKIEATDSPAMKKFKKCDKATQTAIIARHFGFSYGQYQSKTEGQKLDMENRYRATLR